MSKLCGGLGNTGRCSLTRKQGLKYGLNISEEDGKLICCWKKGCRLKLREYKLRKKVK